MLLAVAVFAGCGRSPTAPIEGACRTTGTDTAIVLRTPAGDSVGYFLVRRPACTGGQP